MPSIFTRIINKEIPCHLIAENEQYMAFLDVMPLREGHTLVVPKNEVDYIFDLSAEDLAGLLEFARPIAKAIEKVIPCQRVGLSVIGLEVPHTHLHLVPIDTANDLNFTRSKMPADQAKLADTAALIRSQL
ncbi:MAG: HIT family protein [Chitinophagales bacterium]|jgi:histidine triad (HIT) family protein|nr:HIT family protein [Chitinophagales bacterium]